MMSRSIATSTRAPGRSGAALRAARRGFTLIELVLASGLGIFIIAAVFALFAVLRVSQDRSAARAEALNELANLQGVLAQSFRTLSMEERRRTPATSGRAATARATDANATDKPADARDAAPVKPARLLLEQDSSMPFPRLEVVTAAAPIGLKLADGSRAFVDSESGAGVRGGFELVPGKQPGTFDIVYAAYDINDGPDVDRSPLAQAVVARGFTDFRVKFFKGEESDKDAAATGTPVEEEERPSQRSKDNDKLLELGPMRKGAPLPPDSSPAAWSRVSASRSYNHLPAFVEVEALTSQGLRGRWLFEVKWVIAKEPLQIAGDSGAGGSNGQGDRDRRSRENSTSGSGGSGNTKRDRRMDGVTVEVTGPPR